MCSAIGYSQDSFDFTCFGSVITKNSHMLHGLRPKEAGEDRYVENMSAFISRVQGTHISNIFGLLPLRGSENVLHPWCVWLLVGPHLNAKCVLSGHAATSLLEWYRFGIVFINQKTRGADSVRLGSYMAATDTDIFVFTCTNLITCSKGIVFSRNGIVFL